MDIHVDIRGFSKFMYGCAMDSRARGENLPIHTLCDDLMYLDTQIHVGQFETGTEMSTGEGTS